jgi:23S rRNA (guanosine2251-2'-O)-methyltransferase
MSHVLISGSATSDERLAEVVRTATALGAPMVELGRTELDLLTDSGNHQGVAIAIASYEYADVLDLLDRAARRGEDPLIVALDSVTDPHNLGAVLRSAGAFGAHGVLIPERRSASVNSTVWKVSAGAAARVPVARETNLTRALGEAKKAGCFVVGLDGEGSVSIRDLELATAPLVLVTGSEGKGLSRLVRETCDVVASIPIGADVESLNAAVATGIALYEVDQKRLEGARAEGDAR